MAAPDVSTFWSDVWSAAATSATLAAAAWGAAGGMTSAMSITGLPRRDIIRHVVLGALVAGGLGTVAGALISSWLGLPSAVIPAGGGFGSASYLAGVFGPAVFEVILSRIRAGRLPGDGK